MMKPATDTHWNGFIASLSRTFSGQWNHRILRNIFNDAVGANSYVGSHKANYHEPLSCLPACFADIFQEDVGEGQSSRALPFSLPQELRLTLLHSHPTSQNKQRVAETIQKAYEHRIQMLIPPQSHTETFSSSADRSSLM